MDLDFSEVLDFGWIFGLVRCGNPLAWQSSWCLILISGRRRHLLFITNKGKWEFTLPWPCIAWFVEVHAPFIQKLRIWLGMRFWSRRIRMETPWLEGHPGPWLWYQGGLDNLLPIFSIKGKWEFIVLGPCTSVLCRCTSLKLLICGWVWLVFLPYTPYYTERYNQCLLALIME